MASSSPEVARRTRAWRIKVFAATWCSYAGYYFCRKPLYKVRPVLTTKVGIDAGRIGHIGTAYHGAYALGQFNAAAVGSRTGPRRMVLAGMAISILCNAAAGSLSGFWPLLLLMAVNGLAQSTGWPGNVGTMSRWTRRIDRGTIMGFWSTCYQVGGLAAGLWASYLLGHYSWRMSFFGGGAVLASVVVLFFLLQRDRPEDVGLPPLDEEEERARAERVKRTGGRLGWDRRVITTISLMGATYFCIKFIRYLLLSWAAYFLALNFSLEPSEAGYLSELFDLAGVCGAITAGVISDRLFGGRRSGVILAMLAGMTIACFFLWQAGPGSVAAFTIALAAVGFMIYGPDSLLSGAGAIDVGGEGALAAAGIINGIGSVGSVLQEQVVGTLYKRYAGQLGPIFISLLTAAAVSLLCVGLLFWRSRRGESDL